MRIDKANNNQTILLTILGGKEIKLSKGEPAAILMMIQAWIKDRLSQSWRTTCGENRNLDRVNLSINCKCHFSRKPLVLPSTRNSNQLDPQDSRCNFSNKIENKQETNLNSDPSDQQKKRENGIKPTVSENQR